MKISLTGINKAHVLAALYNHSKPLGMGFLHFDPTPMSEQEAQAILKEQTQFDYLKGRVMKVDLSGEVLDASLYDRDNGEGSAKRILANM